jgi:hypothetical protein
MGIPVFCYYQKIFKMKKTTLIGAVASLAMAVAGLIACEKYKDTPGPDLGLTRKYCNDPAAVNYNDSFPGVPDNSVCRYANELYAGNWLLTDSVFTEDMNFVSTAVYPITFQGFSTEDDSTRSKLLVSGLCQGDYVKITANKYGIAVTDTLIEYSEGAQLFCSTVDTVAGIFTLRRDSLSQEFIDVYLKQWAPDDLYIHIGKAIKQ